MRDSQSQGCLDKLIASAIPRLLGVLSLSN